MQNPFDEMWERFPAFVGFVALLYFVIALKYLMWWWIVIPGLVIIPVTVLCMIRAENEKKKLHEDYWQRNKDRMFTSPFGSGPVSQDMLMEHTRQMRREQEWKKEQETSIDRKFKVPYLFGLSLLLVITLLLKGCGHVFFK